MGDPDERIRAREQERVVAEDVGTAREAISIAPIAANIAIRTAPSSGLIVFVSHAYAAHAHQSTPSTSSPFASPAQVGSSTTMPVTWVIAKTKIRSKKSSSGVTRSSALS